MTNLLAAATLNENLQGIITKLNELMNSFWIYIVLAMAAVVVVWGAYIGITETKIKLMLVAWLNRLSSALSLCS